MMIKDRRLLLGILICLVMALSAACETSFPEWSGQMPNETGSHQAGDNLNQQTADNNSQAIRPIVWHSTAEGLTSAASRSAGSNSQSAACGAAELLAVSAIPATRSAERESNRCRMPFATASAPNSLP